MEEEQFFSDVDTEEITNDTVYVEDETETEQPTEETTEVVSEEVTEPTEPTIETTGDGEKPYRTLKYNHAELPIATEKEYDDLAQIGFHFKNKIEPMYAELQAIQPQFAKFQEIAQLYGMDVDGLHNALYDQYVATQAEETGFTPEQIRKEREIAEREKQINVKVEQKNEQDNQLAMINELFNEYPELNGVVAAIPQEVLNQMFSGKDLVKAYQAYEIKQTKNKIKQLEQNSKNKATSPVASTTVKGSEDPVKEDLFLEGFGSR